MRVLRWVLTDHSAWSLSLISRGPRIAELHPLLFSVIAHDGIDEISLMVQHFSQQRHHLVRPRLKVPWIEASLSGELMHTLHLRARDWVELGGWSGRVLVDSHDRILREDLSVSRKMSGSHHAKTLPKHGLYPYHAIIE